MILPASARAFAVAVRTRDFELAQHSRRVAVFALRLADEIKSGEVDRHALALGAFLHDIGKLGIPESILEKNGPLDPDQRALIQRHPCFGSQMLTSFPELLPAIPIVRHHHQKWDGTGYGGTAKLEGETIPLLARIVSLADVLDAMTSARPYALSLPWCAAAHRIENGAGTQFDPELVEAFQRVPLVEWARLRRSDFREWVPAEDPAGGYPPPVAAGYLPPMD